MLEVEVGFRNTRKYSRQKDFFFYFGRSEIKVTAYSVAPFITKARSGSATA